MDIIVDIDGTVADCSHRLPFIAEGKKDWLQFYAHMTFDTPIEPTIRIIKATYRHIPLANVIWCTGRPEEYITETISWLAHYTNLPTNYLYMRPSKDYRPDYIVKEELLHKMREDGFKPSVAFEDRTKVAEMWRRNGLLCYQVANNEGYA